MEELSLIGERADCGEYYGEGTIVGSLTTDKKPFTYCKGYDYLIKLDNPKQAYYNEDGSHAGNNTGNNNGTCRFCRVDEINLI